MSRPQFTVEHNDEDPSVSLEGTDDLPLQLHSVHDQSTQHDVVEVIVAGGHDFQLA